ncbi:hypothetical protein [Oryza sativa Japonica Group]|uniref:Uncharacterized protein n=1 Tax=Oryza sativa subsp. japonica TaxID=39947 RepID=Q5ZDF2_ORYSJ|nr:hypothetical protein [Oryza sativa Japonica Group]
MEGRAEEGEIVMLRGMTVKGGKHRQVSETMISGKGVVPEALLVPITCACKRLEPGKNRSNIGTEDEPAMERIRGEPIRVNAS